MDWYNHFFLVGQYPANAMSGTYNLKLVALSYIIACLASYVALDMSAHLKKQTNTIFMVCWWIAGAFVMGAGIWSMHFVGMLAFNMDMPMSYDLKWTATSMLIAVIAAAIAFLFFMLKKPTKMHYALSGIILGTAILAMHYTGMAGMNNMEIHYTIGLFLLSVFIALIAATAGLWLAVHSDNRSTHTNRVKMKIISALIMGIAIAGMHYTGMEAAVFTPTHHMVMGVTAEPTMLATLITVIILCIMSVPIITKYHLNTRINDKNFLEIVLNNLRGSIIAFDANQKIRLYNEATKDLFINIASIKDISNDCDVKIPLYKPDSKTLYTAKDHPIELIFQNKEIKGVEAIIYNTAGKKRFLSIDGQILRDQYGEKIGTVIVSQDITSRKEIDQMKNEFISTVSHELRTPLTSIRGSLGLIIGGAIGKIPKEMQPLLEIAANNSERLVRLINDILDTEKIEAGKMVFHFEKTNLSNLIQQSVASNKSYADKYQVHYKITNIIPEAFAKIDSDRISQVLDNLLSNAAKFSKTGDTISIAIQSDQNNKYIEISITDTGIGIPQEFQSHIFSKFYQADSSDVREKGGTGLGLSICKSIIEAHDGKIWFESTPNIGTTFHFTLPLLNSNSEIAPNNENILELNDDKNKTILICEDEPDVSKLLGLILKQRGFNSVHTATIAEAKRILSTQEFCLMTLDLLLPDGNGLELLQWMRSDEKLQNLPVVIISAISIEEQKIKGSALGVIDWIDKPIDENRLYKDVATALGNKNLTIKPKVLHVEDDADISKIVATVIKDICDTDVSSTISTAKKLITKNNYELIILDLNLKDGSGYELLSFLENNSFRIPIVILSVDEAKENISKNIAASLVKSKISNHDLLDKIVSIIESNKHGTKI